MFKKPVIPVVMLVLSAIVGAKELDAKSDEGTALPQFQCPYVSKSHTPTKNHISNFTTITESDGEEGVTLAIGDLFFFNNKSVVGGDAIKQKNSTTFQIKKAGDYYVHFSGTLSPGASGAPGAVYAQVNGKIIGIKSIFGGTIVVLEEIIKISESDLPAKIQFINADLTTTLLPGDRAEVSIIKLGGG